MMADRLDRLGGWIAAALGAALGVAIAMAAHLSGKMG